MAEDVISSIAGEIVSFQRSRELENVGKLWGVKRELKALWDIVSKLQLVLEDAEKQYRQNVLIRHWVEDLKDAFYDAHDMLEEFNIEALRRELRGRNKVSKEVRTFFSSSNQLAFHLKMSYKVKDVRKRMERIEASKGFHLQERCVREWTKIETHSFIHEEAIIGREEDKHRIIDFLLDSGMPGNISILSIVGMGGIGKTTLAQLVYNDAMVSKHFQLKMWICVPDDFDMKKIVINMITHVKKKKPIEDEMEQLQRELMGEIYGKRYLLVLDDLWIEDRENWLKLRVLLEGGAKGSKILITTRLCLVPKITDARLIHHLSGLSKTDSYALLMRIASRNKMEIDDMEMQAILEEIASNCDGVPLVLRVVGSLLFFKRTKNEWLRFKNDELPKVSEDKSYNISILRCVYENLPSHLKQCFAFCSLFPSNYEIDKETLINLWVAEGLIQSSIRSQHLEDIAHEYLMDLVRHNFLQDLRRDPFTNKVTCRMHDLMHDLACSVVGTKHWVAGDDTKSIHERTYRIYDGLITNLIGGLPNSCSRASFLKTFLSTPTFREMDQREEISEANLRQLIESFKRLRILDMHAAIVQKVPRSICKLKFLTYLDLSYNSALKRLPNSITRLHNLQTLNLHGCFALEELPRDIRKLVKLRNLDIDYCYGLSYLPCGLGQLSSLHMLTRFILPNGRALAKNYCRLKELNALNDIQKSLCIENLGSVTDVEEESKDANLIAKKSLESLALKWGNFDTNYAEIEKRDESLLNGLRPHPNLEKLMINRYNGESFPRWMMDDLSNSLPKLVEVRLFFCGRCKHLPPLGRLPFLKTLELWGLTELEHIESCDSSTSAPPFPELLQLEIHYCTKLKDAPLTPLLEDLTLREVDGGLINQITGLKKLKSLHISQIKTLRCLPERCLESLTSLERLTISECEELDLSTDESGNILYLSRLTNLQFLGIHGVRKLAALRPWLQQASYLKILSIKECFNLKEFPELPEQMDAYALRSLQQLEIIRCPSLTSIPEGMRRLPSLSHLKIVGCPILEKRYKPHAGEDWNKIAHIPHIFHKLKDYEHLL